MIDSQAADYIAKLQDADWRVRKSAVIALGSLDDPAVTPALAGSLTDAFPSVRAFAAIELGKREAAAAVPELTAALQDEEWIVRKNVVRALLKIGEPSTVPVLLEMLQDNMQAIRALVAFEMGKRGELAVIPTLVEMLQSEEAHVRTDAAGALASMGVPAVGTLLQYLAHRPVQKAVSGVLWQMGDATTLPRKIVAERRLTARDRIVVLEKLRRARLDGLTFHYKFPSTRDLCLAVLNEEDEEARAGAQTVLNWLNGERHLVHSSQSEPENDLEELLRASPGGGAEVPPETLLRGAVEPPENAEPPPRLSPWQRLFGKR